MRSTMKSASRSGAFRSGATQVVTTPAGVPLRLHRSGRRYTVREVLGCWVVGSAWWRGGAADDTQVWRVLAVAAGGQAAILDLRRTTEGWRVGRVRS